ncbi:hypothetical protein JL721_9586 [Aureococcus anophagefferens]|nr:hypothetical protein JL721_9586 [Aureococcus anophagefferens]
MTARSLVLLATWARAEWCAVQIANVFGDAPLSVEWRLDAAPDVVAAAAAAVVDELPASAWPAAVEAAVRSTMAAHRANGCAGSPAPRAFDAAPIAAAAPENLAAAPYAATNLTETSPWPARTATRAAAASAARSRRPRAAGARAGRPRRARRRHEATARTSATVESEGVFVDAAWAERGRDLVVFASGRQRGRALPWASLRGASGASQRRSRGPRTSARPAGGGAPRGTDVRGRLRRRPARLDGAHLTPPAEGCAAHA